MNNPIRQIITIADRDLTIIEHKGERVVTLAMIDQVHQRPEGTAKRNFHENRRRFEEGKHYFLVPRSGEYEFRTLGIEVPNRGLTVLTQRGYLLLVKSFTDELSWQVQDMLIDGYFEGQRQTTQPSASRIANHRMRLSLAKELYRTRDRSLREVIHQQLADVSTALGLPIPAMDSLGRATPPPPDILLEFWKALAVLDHQGIPYNHSKSPGLLAINAPSLAKLFEEHGITVIIDRRMQDAWRSSTDPLFVESKAVDSALFGKIAKCWVFEQPA
ncbi:ORF6N domain-containing protein [Pseudomonas sp. C9-3]|uniref:ORF6N domain-containing protein n=1 Tax=Pseudomonas sp. C9-3 TaxID=3078264 RepID=UPI0028E338D7|nr:ORF6N domain-containing protein [Pseudomonas sp. C9-3]